jgi:hypothetical protein
LPPIRRPMAAMGRTARTLGLTSAGLVGGLLTVSYLLLRRPSNAVMGPSGLHNWRWPARRCRPAAGYLSEPRAGSNPTPALFIVWQTGMGFLIGCFWPTVEAREWTRLSIVEPREKSASPNPL